MSKPIEMHIHSDIYVPSNEVHLVCNPEHYEYIRDFLSQYFPTFIYNIEIGRRGQVDMLNDREDN